MSEIPDPAELDAFGPEPVFKNISSGWAGTLPGPGDLPTPPVDEGSFTLPVFPDE